jgi:hypothetical protein
MAELEIHHEREGESADPLEKKIGVLASVLAVILAIVTIVSHRAHTDAVLLKADANDKWAFYQAKKIKFHSLELGVDLLHAMPAQTPQAEAMVAKYEKEKVRYTRESDEAQADAKNEDAKAEHVEHKALRYDFGEGLLEIGLVLTSLYFIARSKLFPTLGVISAVAGIAAAIWGYFI